MFDWHLGLEPIRKPSDALALAAVYDGISLAALALAAVSDGIRIGT